MAFFPPNKSVTSIYLYVVGIWLMVSPSVVGQSKFIRDSLIWKNFSLAANPLKTTNAERLYFENAVFSDSSNLPVYQVKVPIGRELAPFSVELKPHVSVPLSVQEYSMINPESALKDSICIRQKIVIEKKIRYLQLSFVPLFKNKLSGNWEKLVSFSLIISTDPSTLQPIKRSIHAYTSQSLLSTGDWYKFLIPKSGVYKMTFGELKKMGIKNPENLRIYGYGGKKLPEVFSVSNPDDLIEIPVMVNAQSASAYTDADLILFYAEGPVTWSFNTTTKTFQHQIHPFTDQSVYFMTSNPDGKKIANKTLPATDATNQVTSFDGLDYHESDLVNFLRSGRNWYGEEFGVQSYFDFLFTFPNLVSNENIKIDGELLSRSETNTSFSIKANNVVVGNVSMPGNATDDLSDYASIKKFETSFLPSAEKTTIRLVFSNNGNTSARGWLNYFQLSARQQLKMTAGQLSFRDSRSFGSGNIVSYSVSNANDGTLIWDITNLNNVQKIDFLSNNGTLTFKDFADQLNEYIAFEPKSAMTPTYINQNFGKVQNQNLHGLPLVDLIIISHPDFLNQANELAEIHQKHDNLTTLVVTPQQIYNEFSSGMPDPAAIRNFLKMFYDRAENSENAPKYVLLYGDGSYDNKNETINGVKNTNYIPTFESENSVSPTYSYVSDDYYGLLDDDEKISDGLLDVGIGRFPVQDTIHSKHLIEKINQYLSAENYGSWRNTICFIADDEDNNIHMEQANQLAIFMENNHPGYNIDKIYLDAYQQVSTSSGDRYPDVNTAITNRVNNGALIINYTGHGGETGLAHEQVLRQKEDIGEWTNDKFPLFITATCDLSRFDDYQKTTAGEDILMNLHGGGIALLTTTRLVYSAPNFVLNQQFYTRGLSKSTDNPSFKLGDMFRITKNNAGNDVNKLNFTLLGDPALSLAIPKYRILTDSINHHSSSNGDTLRAYSEIVLKGKILGDDDQKLSAFNGILNTTIFDKTKKISTLGNNEGVPFDFTLRNNVLFKGKSSVKNGEFQTNIMMPRDMDYSFGKGKISFYATDSIIDANGENGSVIIGGLQSNVVPNNQGPEIRLFLNDTTFKSGGITNEYPILIGIVRDDDGINPGGNGLGHDIVAMMDNDPKQTFILNSSYETNMDDFRRGIIEYKLPKVSVGKHRVSLKLWDNFNNSAQKEITFNVIGENSLVIQHLYNYPNPAVDYTNFYFEHNQSDTELEVSIEIMNTSGSLVTKINQKIFSAGYSSGPIYWNLNNQNFNKILPGIYLYRVIIRSLNKISVSSSNKLIIIN